jgi:large subunit ribosomal protein L10
MMTGQVAATFVYGEDFAAFKALYTFSKEQDKLKILGGFVAGKAVGFEDIKKLALVPSREESLAKMLGSMMSPVSGFARILNAYKEKLEAAAKAAAAPAPVAAPVVAEAPAAAAPAAPAAPVAAA